MSNNRINQIIKKFDTQLRDKINQKNSNNINEATFLNRQFKYFDVLNKGSVNFDQFQRAIEKIGVVMSQFDLEQVFKRYDSSGDGNIDFKEFSVMFSSGTAQTQEDTPLQSPPKTDAYIQEKQKQQVILESSRHDSPDALLRLFRDKLKQRGIRGMVGLQRIFQMMDDDNNGSLSQIEFWKACKDFKVGISEENVPILFKAFDVNGDGTMDYDEFLILVRGEMSEERTNFVKQIYEFLVERRGNDISVDDIKSAFLADKHPDVIQGHRTSDNVLVEFIETFEAHHNLGDPNNRQVSMNEWIDYFTSVSATFDSDDHFSLMLSNTFGVKDFQVSKARHEQAVNQAKHQKLEQAQKIQVEGKGVYRSGMGSNSNPLNTTKDYYPKVNNAAVGNVSKGMYSNVPAFSSNIEHKEKSEYAQFKNKNDKTQFLKVAAPSSVPKFQGILVQRFRKALRERGGRGIAGLSRQFKIFDDNNSGTLDADEFTKAIKDFGVDIEEIDIMNLFKTMDYDQSGGIDFNEFVRVIVGEMSPFRQNLVEKAFRTLDVNQDGEISLEEFCKRYNAQSHPDVRHGRRTEEEVLVEFMETFQEHHNKQTGASRDNKISLDEFIEYYNQVSCNIENDNYFDQMMSSAWELDGSSNPANMPFAGTKQKINNVNAREAYRQDHHRNLFGTDNSTPFSKKKGTYETSKNSDNAAVNSNTGGAHAAAGEAYNAGDSYKVDYTGIKHSDDELVQRVRAMLAKRGARGMIGLQRIFKIMDDNNSGTLDIQEFWKAVNDFRVKISQDECRKLFDLFDEDDNGELSIDEFLINIRGVLNNARREIITKAFNKLDADQSGTLDVSDVKRFYNASNHPDVKSGKKTEDEVLLDFLETFEVHRSLSRGDKASAKGDGKVNINEFMDYYSNVSASIDDDEYFNLMMTNAWNLDNKKYGKAWGAEY